MFVFKIIDLFINNLCFIPNCNYGHYRKYDNKTYDNLHEHILHLFLPYSPNCDYFCHYDDAYTYAYDNLH